jgi:hypothetical protein
MLGAALLLACSALAGPPLTTIDDVLYKADGTRFNGLVTIAWSSFQASDLSEIQTQMITLKVVNGHLHVRLVPTTTANPEIYYTVTYNSDGLVQFTELWSVPPSSTPLNLNDVRVSGVTISGTGTTGTTGTTGDDTNAQAPIPESDVTGLVADLNARPVEGPAFAPGSVAFIDAQGLIDAVAGSPNDCVYVDGSSGPCGSSQPGFMDGDLPSGAINGTNTSFTLSAVPNPSTSLALYRNGVLQQLGTDYTLTNNNVVQFAAISTPQPGDTLLANYRLSNTNTTAQLYPSPQVLCSGTGATINGASFSSLGTCSIPAGTLAAGNHIEIRFDLAHQGSAGGFTFLVQWGSTTVVERTASISDAAVSGHADAGLDQSGAQVSSQSWGTVLPFSANVGSATDAYASGLVISFQGAMGASGDTLTLRNYAVVQLP